MLFDRAPGDGAECDPIPVRAGQIRVGSPTVLGVFELPVATPADWKRGGAAVAAEIRLGFVGRGVAGCYLGGVGLPRHRAAVLRDGRSRLGALRGAFF